MRFDIAAALPVAAVTVHIAFRQVADLKAGDRVLIHGATGGVGLAALALARRIGAEVFATARLARETRIPSPNGYQTCFDSRTLDFADEVLAATKGVGVRVALNSLTGSFVEATFGHWLRRARLSNSGNAMSGRWTRSRRSVPTFATAVRCGCLGEAEPALLGRDVRCVRRSGTARHAPCAVGSTPHTRRLSCTAAHGWRAPYRQACPEGRSRAGQCGSVRAEQTI